MCLRKIHGNKRYTWALEGFFPGGALGDFSKYFLGGPKVLKNFSPLESKKTTFFAEIFKIQGIFPPPSDAHDGTFDPEIAATIEN